MKSLLLPCILACVLAACDDGFSPVAAERTDHFAVYGFLDTEADTQFVRISPLRDTLEPLDPAETVGTLQVASLHLQTSRQVSWQDSLVVLDDGQTGVLFFAPLSVAPGEAYRLFVTGPDGASTTAVTQIPRPVRLRPDTLLLDFNRRLVQRVTLLGQPVLPTTLRVRYEVTPPGATEPVALTVPFFDAGPLTPDGPQIVVNLEADREEILQQLGVPRIDSTVVLHRLGLEVEQLSTQWDQGDDPANNISNGFGFFGSIARYVVSWTLDAEQAARVGYRVPE